MRIDAERGKKVAKVIGRLPYVSTDVRMAELIGVGKVEFSKWKNDGEKIPVHKERRFYDIAQIEPGWLELSLEKLEAQLEANPYHEHPEAWNPPRTPTPFIGRDKELKLIKNKIGVFFGKNGSESNILSIHGVPGVGKSTVAAWLANDPEILMVFSDAVLWSTFGQLTGNVSDLDFQACERLTSWGGLLGDEYMSKAMQVNELTERVENLLQKRRALLICDDVWDIDHVISIRRLADRGVYILFTSRFTDIAHKLAADASNVIELKGFNESDAIKLLKTIAPDVVARYPSETEALVRDLEYLPLAINVAGHLLRRELAAGLNVISMIDELRNEGEQLLQEALPPDMVELIREAKSPTVAAWLMRSIRVLDKPTRDFFISLGSMAAKPATFGLRELKMRWGDRTKVIIRKLVDTGLVQTTTDQRYQMHALLVTLARSMRTQGQ